MTCHSSALQISAEIKDEASAITKGIVVCMKAGMLMQRFQTHGVMPP